MLPTLLEYLSRVKLKCPTLTNHHTDDVTPDIVKLPVSHKSLRLQGCTAGQMSTERGGPNSLLKNRADHFARHLHSRLRSLSETEDASWSAAGDQVSLSSSSDNEIFYDIDSNLASPQEEATEPEFINHHPVVNLADNSKGYIANDNNSACSSNGPIRRNSSDVQFYDTEREDLKDCTQLSQNETSELCKECYRKALINVNSNKELKYLTENRVNGIDFENKYNNAKQNADTCTLSLCDKCIKRKESCDISYPKYSKVWREHNISVEESPGMLRSNEKWNDADLTGVRDDCSKCSRASQNNEHLDVNGLTSDKDEHHDQNGETSSKDDHIDLNGQASCKDDRLDQNGQTGENGHRDHNGQASGKDEYHEQNGQASDKEERLDQNGQASGKDERHEQHGQKSYKYEHHDQNGPLPYEEGLPSSQTETRNNCIDEAISTPDIKVDILSCDLTVSNSATNERLDDAIDSDNNLSLSDLLQVLHKEYKNKSEPSNSSENSETKVGSCSVSNVSQSVEQGKSLKPVVNDEDEEEDIEVRRLRFRRCSSLKTGKTPPGTPGRKKIVRFADVLGLDLADVKTFLDEVPTIPKSAYEDLHGIELSSSPLENAFRISTPVQKSERVLLPLFQQPGGQPFFLDHVRDKNVCLENAIVSDPVLFAITGTVRVKNIDFHKSVHVRYTIDNWTSFADLQARYVPNSCDGFSDKFTFLLYAHTLNIGQRIEFAVRFQAKGLQYWDNNGGTNYTFQCVNQDPSPSIQGVHIPSYAPQSPADTWASFY